MKVSVIVPCYNVENRVRDCLDSLVGQSFGIENMEIILVDDASTDGTVSILKEYEERYPDNIMVILCEENGRQGKARNIGIGYASGDWISFVDADDQAHTRMYEVIDKIDKKYAPDLISIKYTSEESVIKSDIDIDNAEYSLYEFDSIEKRKEFVLRGDLINNSCWQKIYKTELVRIAGVSFAEGVCYEEPLFTYPMRYMAKRIVLTDLPLYFYHLNPDGTINQTMKDPMTIQDHLKVQAQVLDYMRRQSFYDDLKDEIELNFLHCFVYEPYIFLGRRGFSMPDSLFASISNMVKNMVPDWQTNPYLQRIPQDEYEYIARIADV